MVLITETLLEVQCEVNYYSLVAILATFILKIVVCRPVFLRKLIVDKASTLKCSSFLEKFVAIAKHCEYVLTNYEMKTLNAQQCHEIPLRPSISPQSDWLNQNQVSVDGTSNTQGQSTDEAATSSHPLMGAVTILANTAHDHLPLISFFLVLIIALSVAMLSEAQVSVPKQIAKS